METAVGAYFFGVRGGGSGSARTIDAESKCATSWNQTQTLKECFLLSRLSRSPMYTFVQNCYSFLRSL